MRELGIDAFRFSIAWPRVLPEGRGRVNQAGLDFYDRLTDELLAAGIQPCVTLYHWDLPQVLEDAGGWPERATAHALPELAAAVADRLGDRVTRWITLNEPWVLGLARLRLGRARAGSLQRRRLRSRPSHHLLLAHGLATDVLRERCRGAEVGVTLNLTHADPGDRGRGRPRRGTLRGRALQPLVPRSALQRPLPGRHALRGAGARRRPRGDLRVRSTSWASTTTRARSAAPARTAGRPCRCTCPARPTPTWAGRSTRTGSASCSSASPGTTRRRRSS